MTRELHDWVDDLARAHTYEGITVLRRHALEVARKAGRVGIDPAGNITTPAFDPIDGTLIDVVTVAADHEREIEFHLLTGMAVMLGEPPFLDEINLYPPPMDWLQAGCDGICIINYEKARRFLCGKPPLRLICRDRDHAADTKVRLWLDMPRLILATPAQRLAA